MFPSGDDLVVEFPAVSWLLWLHLLVMFLFFLLLLSYLGILVFPSTDDPPGSTSAAHFSNNDRPGAKLVDNNCNNKMGRQKDKFSLVDLCIPINGEISNSVADSFAKAIKFQINASRRPPVTEDLTTIKGHLTTSTGRIELRVGKEQDEEEEIEEMGESSPMMVNQRTILHFCVNPCYYLGQFFRPFLKCFGLPSTYQDSSKPKKGRRSKKS